MAEGEHGGAAREQGGASREQGGASKEHRGSKGGAVKSLIWLPPFRLQLLLLFT